MHTCYIETLGIQRDKIKNLRFGDEGVDQVMKRDGRSHSSQLKKMGLGEGDEDRYPLFFKFQLY